VVSTVPADAPGAGAKGLVARVRDGNFGVVLGNQTVLSSKVSELAGPGCALRLTSTAATAQLAARRPIRDPRLVAGALASLTWLPFALAVLRGAPRSGAAQRYLPDSGTLLPLPMTEVSLLGGLCLVGTGWLVLRVRTSPIARH